jgi:hypothetical protein
MKRKYFPIETNDSNPTNLIEQSHPFMRFARSINLLFHFSITITLILSLILLLTSCSKDKHYVKQIKDGITYHKNDGKSDNTTQVIINNSYEIALGDIDSIRNINMPIDATFDKYNNIYIADGYSANIKKFDSKYQYVKTIGKRGQGPGEMSACASVFISGDTLSAYDPMTFRLIKYDLNGNFISTVNVGCYLQFIKVCDKNYVALEQIIDKQKNQMQFNLNIYSANWKKIKTLFNSHLDLNKTNGVDIFSLIPVFQCVDNEIYVAKNSMTYYEIEIFNSQGQLNEKIKKNYSAINVTKEELKMINDSFQKMSQGKSPDITISRKQAISGIFFDAQGQIWVKKSVDRNKEKNNNLYFDIFRDGNLVNMVSVNNLTGTDFFNYDQQLFFNQNKIFEINLKKGMIVVYEIK